MTKEEFDNFVENVLGMEEVFPTNNERPYDELMKMIGKPTQAGERVALSPGDQFCINQDGSASITRKNGDTEEFYPEDGWISISINV